MSINFFEAIFNDTILDPTGDTQVCCPFPHRTDSGRKYYETNPSMGVNLDKNVAHCFSCNKSFSETSFCAEYLGISYGEAKKFLNHFHKSKSLEEWKYAEQNINCKGPTEILNKLKISPNVVKQLHIGYRGGGNPEISIPIIIFGQVMDIITYRPGQVPKYKKETGSLSGLICPFDLWREEPKERNTLICAGEKDMMKARSMGFNAISFTGGEQNLPELFLNMFEDRKIYIVYDNDEAGRNGSKSLAALLKKYTNEVHVVDISVVCKENKEDLYDFFTKYGKTKNDLIEILKNTPIFTKEESEEQMNKIYPIVPLKEALQPKNINRTIRSNVQVIATVDTAFVAPTLITGEKVETDDEDEGKMSLHEKREWFLNETNYKDLFYLIDSNLKENAIIKHKKTSLLKIPANEKGIKITDEVNTTVYKAFVADCLDDMSDGQAYEMLAYSLNKKLENGKKYLITYRLIPHPQDGQKIVMVIKDVEEANTFMDNFNITDNVKNILSNFQVPKDSTLDIKLKELIEKVKGIVNADYNEMLLTIIDLWYNSVLKIKVGREEIRGYLDVLVVGESRTGKSSTVDALKNIYQLGKTISLAGSAATIQGIIGGSDKIAGGSYKTRAGVIPQNNRGAIIFEELIKCKADLVKSLTDIRSSNKVRISRVNGTIELPAYVRMLTITNPKQDENKMPKPINSYPNGISILTDIIGSAEDIARYDILAIFGFEATKEIDPFYEPPTPFPEEYYRTRIQWIWSRKPEQIIVTSDVYRYTITKMNEVNKIYSTYINIFGVEAWKKFLRLAAAIAGYVVSTDETFEKIIIEKQHVDKAIEILINLYDNPTFKLKQYANKEKSYNSTTEEDTKVLEQVYRMYPVVIEQIYERQTLSRQVFSSFDIMSESLNKVLQKLSNHGFIRLESYNIVSTPKLTMAYDKLDKKQISMQREVSLDKW